MGKPISPQEERLASRLRSEAKSTRPEFSESLHERICQTLEGLSQSRASGATGVSPVPGHKSTSAAERVPTAARPWAIRRPYRSWATVAAVCLVGVLLAVWQLDVLPGPERSETADSAPQPSEVDEEIAVMLDAFDDPAGHIDVLVELTLLEERWAYLDHDARLLGQMLSDSLPLETHPAGELP